MIELDISKIVETMSFGVTWKCSSFVFTVLEDSPSTEAGSFLLDLAAGDGEEEAS